ncbi:hypothetical protein BDQ12DRAFT_687833 [Crucibulum laeve]|uniref:Uncharacterized protein n=1 Tax=Crucibulum laeve TaxID=68775 RepID=A0A5C3LUF4_9AGAR|nr:hypothetical protein BDQ12DRAFT_687833 [Crucibulum laeve]
MIAETPTFTTLPSTYSSRLYGYKELAFGTFITQPPHIFMMRIYRPFSLLISGQWDPNQTITFYGSIISAVGYGVLIALFVLSMFSLNRPRAFTTIKTRMAVYFYLCSIFTICSIYIICSTLDTCIGLVKYSCGAIHTVPSYISITQDICFFLVESACDAFLIWRCLIMYTGPLYLGLIPPVMLTLFLVGECGTGIVVVIYHIAGVDQEWQHRFMDIHILLSLVVNIVVTTMIVTRIIYHQYRLTAHLNSNTNKPYYTSIISLSLKMGVFLAVFEIFFFVTFHLRHPLALIPSQCMVQVQGIGTFFVIFRVSCRNSQFLMGEDDEAQIVSHVACNIPSITFTHQDTASANASFSSSI